jgi:hypothetical protein
MFIKTLSYIAHIQVVMLPVLALKTDHHQTVFIYQELSTEIYLNIQDRDLIPLHTS